MKNLHKTLLFTIIFSLVIVIIVVCVQLSGSEALNNARCSYFDPITIDILAFIAAIFLVIEGFVRIFEHPNASLKQQFTRMLRIAFGFSILTLHIIQFFYK